jgi:4-amino-4-deoxy-L-arabinose transferase-like glycosyltransferase
VFLLVFSCFSCLSWSLFFHRLTERDLWSSHEGRAAQDAQSVLDSGHWGLPRLFDHHVELQKPPLYYWFVALLARLRGGSVDAFAVRLPAALAAVGGVLFLAGLGWWRDRPLAGLGAAAMLATAVHYTWLGRTGRIDMPLTLAVSLALGGFYLGQHASNGSRALVWYLLAYLAVAGAVLLKGPIGALLPAAVAGMYLLVKGELPAPWHPRRWLALAHRLGLWWGGPLVLGLSGAWFVWAQVQTEGELFRVFVWKHNIERGLGGGTLASHPWWYYGPRLAVDLLPWSPLLPLAGWLLWRQDSWRGDPEARFGLVWLLTMVAVLSCLRFKRADYLLPAYPGAALFLGCAAEHWYRGAAYPRRLVTAFGLGLAGCAAGWWVYVGTVLPDREPAQEHRRFAAEIRRRAPAPQLILFFRAEVHALAFHVGRPMDTLLEWENLDWWAARPETYYVVMPPQTASEWPHHLRTGRLAEVLRNTDLSGGAHAQPLVLLRTCPEPGPVVPGEQRTDARSPATAADRDRSAQCRAAGAE